MFGTHARCLFRFVTLAFGSLGFWYCHAVVTDAPPSPKQEVRVPGKPYTERWLERAPSFEPVELGMLYIPQGTFVMGSPPEEAGHHPSESPRHEVKVSAFWMSKYEITWLVTHKWRYAEGGPPKFYDWPDQAVPVMQDDEPAVALTQFAAQEFCRWLSKETGRLYRLPTEAEWEYACRAGTTTAWHFGDDPKQLGEFAWYGEPFAAGSQQVGKKKPNAWGLYDMHGNVAEWTLDGWSEDYRDVASRASRDPWVRRADQSEHGVVRGGDWTSRPEATRSPARRKELDERMPDIDENTNWIHRTPSGIRVGFRVVSPVKPEKDDRERSIKKYIEHQQ
jgi:formylglycine-generating enzyme required for sulfatase activity